GSVEHGALGARAGTALRVQLFGGRDFTSGLTLLVGVAIEQTRVVELARQRGDLLVERRSHGERAAGLGDLEIGALVERGDVLPFLARLRGFAGLDRV